LRILEPVGDTRWANWAIKVWHQFARYSSRKPILRQALEMVAGVRFELTTFGLCVEDLTLSPVDSIALISMRPAKTIQNSRVLDPSWTLIVGYGGSRESCLTLPSCQARRRDYFPIALTRAQCIDGDESAPFPSTLQKTTYV
jgi:hypothetical protein